MSVSKISLFSRPASAPKPAPKVNQAASVAYANEAPKSSSAASVACSCFSPSSSSQGTYA